MAGSWFRSAAAVALIVAVPAVARAQISAAERSEIVRLAQARSVAAADIAPQVDEADRAAARGLPHSALVNKIKEGIAKGHPPGVVVALLRDMVGQLEAARGLLGNAGDEATRARATLMLAEALGRGVTGDEIQELRRLAEEGGRATPPAGLALGARFWSQLKEAGFTRATLPLVADTVRQDYRAADVTALAREMTARREELSTATRLDAMRQAIRRGERPERVLPPRDAGTVERTRPEPARTPERPQRERPERGR